MKKIVVYKVAKSGNKGSGGISPIMYERSLQLMYDEGWGVDQI